jgi:hypothetical protein
MSSGRKFEKEELSIIEKLVNIVGRLIEDDEENLPIFTLSTIIQHQLFIMSDITLTLGTPKTGLFTLTDNKTGIVITDAVFSNQAIGTNSAPTIAVFALDTANPSHLIASPLASGTGTIEITTDAKYTDPGDGTVKTGLFTATKLFAVLLLADGATFDVVFPS